jgi:hypothetical protein
MAVHAGTLVRPARLDPGPILTVCLAPDCSTLTLGGTCVDHDPRDLPTYPRGRPFVRVTSSLQGMSA